MRRPLRTCVGPRYLRAFTARRACLVVWVWALVSVSAGCASALQPLPAATAPGAEERAEDADILYADLRRLLREIEAEPSANAREAMATDAVRLGQRCERAAPDSAQCDYGLGLALGVQARERPATAHDGLALMIRHLQRAATLEPGLDHAGPERVLGLVLVRAPAWPTGPGDAEKGLEVTRKAAAREPEYPANWLAVAEAADATGHSSERKEAARTAAELADKAAQAGVPDATAWQRAAKEMLRK